MNFTEIQLARDMKEFGLEWKPQMGDWFYVCWEDDVRHVCTCCGSTITSFYNDDVNEFDVKDCVWLPSWSQCRKILAENGITFTFSCLKNNPCNMFLFYKEADDGWRTFIGEVKVDTDLDAMYQSILMWVLDAPRIAGDVEIGNGV